MTFDYISLCAINFLTIIDQVERRSFLNHVYFSLNMQTAYEEKYCRGWQTKTMTKHT